MIYPATHNITVLQNSTWKGRFRATENRQAVVIDSATDTFTATCHGLSANDKVVFTAATGAVAALCGLTLNTVYYVIATGLTADEFKVSATEGGSALSFTGTATGTFYFATPLDITTYVIDSDIKGINDGVQVMTCTATITDATNGEFELVLTPAVTSPVTAGLYGYDVSLTSPGGERYYWVKGTVTVEKTYSRNT